MYSMIYLIKETENKDEVIYKFGPTEELFGRVLLKKNCNPKDNMPIELEPVKCEKPEFFFNRAAMRLARYFMNGNVYPDKDSIATGL